MSTRVVVSQPMLFPWPGMLEQLAACDVYVHYDDVQFSKGSFTNRVQVKTAGGIRWLTVPLHALHLGQHIKDVRVETSRDWRRAHVELLTQAYRGAPHEQAMLELVERVYALQTPWLCEVATASMTALADAFGVRPPRELWSHELDARGHGSERVLAVVRAAGGDEYVTGHGARNYLEHEAFEAHGVKVRYLKYACEPYPQKHGAFTPYVSALDLYAAEGPEGRRRLASQTVDWKEFLACPK